MDTIVAGEGNLDKIGGCDRQRSSRMRPSERLLEVSSWIMILGTVRLICAFGGYAGAFLDSLGSGRTFLEEPVPLLAGQPAGGCGRLELAAPPGTDPATDPEPRPAAGRGAHVLHPLVRRGSGRCGAAVDAIAPDHRLRLVRGLAVGPGAHEPGLRGAGADGFARAGAEFATAVAAWTLAHRSARLASAGPADEPRRRLHGRLAVYVSLAFLVLNVRVPFWSVYEEMLNRSTLRAGVRPQER